MSKPMKYALILMTGLAGGSIGGYLGAVVVGTMLSLIIKASMTTVLLDVVAMGIGFGVGLYITINFMTRKLQYDEPLDRRRKRPILA